MQIDRLVVRIFESLVVHESSVPFSVQNSRISQQRESSQKRGFLRDHRQGSAARQKVAKTLLKTHS
jgi:hypothetical protein